MLDELQKRRFYIAGTIIIGVAVAFVGFAVGIKMGKASTIASLFKVGAIPQPQGEFHNVRGKVISINTENKNLLLETKILTNLLSQEKNVRIKVSWRDTTEIFRQENKNAEQYQHEFSNYQAAVQKNPTLVPPDYTLAVKLNLADLEVGQEIDIFSKENVKDKTKITADSISIITQ